MRNVGERILLAGSLTHFWELGLQNAEMKAMNRHQQQDCCQNRGKLERHRCLMLMTISFNYTRIVFLLFAKYVFNSVELYSTVDSR